MPKTPQPDAKRRTIAVSVSDQEYAAFMQRAHTHGQKMGAYLREVLSEHLKPVPMPKVRP